jgi:hypothetical protein
MKTHKYSDWAVRNIVVALSLTMEATSYMNPDDDKDAQKKFHEAKAQLEQAIANLRNCIRP